MRTARRSRTTPIACRRRRGRALRVPPPIWPSRAAVDHRSTFAVRGSGMSSAPSVAPAEPPLRVVDVQAEDIDRYPNLIGDIADQRFHVALVRGVFSPADAARV